MIARLRVVCWAAVLGGILLVSLAGGNSTQASGLRVGRAEDCRECHADQYAGWMFSSHRLTLYDSTFQKAWERVDHSTECLTCHTTNFEAETGPDYWGVTCLACHTRAENQEADDLERDHEIRTVPEDSSACATCHQGDHTVTYIEWAASEHGGYTAVDCQDCHNPHSGHLAAETVTALCESCHYGSVTEVPAGHSPGRCSTCHVEAISTNNVHMNGGEEAPAVCNDCHMPTEHDFKGYLTTGGHSLAVSVSSCVGCHGALHTMQAD